MTSIQKVGAGYERLNHRAGVAITTRRSTQRVPPAIKLKLELQLYWFV